MPQSGNSFGKCGGKLSEIKRPARFTRWGKADRPGDIELYDYQLDPEELRNLTWDPNQIYLVNRLAALFDERIRAAAEPPTVVYRITMN